MTRLLLVEDNPENRDMLSRRLLKRGFQVDFASNGEEAITAATTGPDLILMDLNLPILDGWEASRRIKANPNTATIPIIALTAHAMSGDRQTALDAGCDDYDSKPIDLPRLLEKIQALLPPGSTSP